MAESLIQLILSSLLGFFVLALIVETTLFLIGVKKPRLRVLFRLIPLLKLPLDLFFSVAVSRSFFIEFNPLSCDSMFQQHIISWLPEGVQERLDGSGLTLMQFGLGHIPSDVLPYLVAAFVVASLFFVVRTALLIGSSAAIWQAIRAHARPCLREVVTPWLQEALETARIELRISADIATPVAIGRRLILLPHALADTLSQEEFEAVIAHELEHLRWRDPFFRVVAEVLAACFWWIPTRWWLSKVEEDQEKACDAAVHRYLIDGQALATAFVKSIGHSRSFSPLICRLGAANRLLMERVQCLLHNDHTYLLARPRIACSACALACVVAAALVWIC